MRGLGWLCANLPEGFSRLLCAVAGDLIFFLPTKRRYTVLSNLHHAFPGRAPMWHRKIGRESCRRLVEMVVFVVASEHFSEARLARLVSIAPEAERLINEHAASDPRGAVGCLPHFSLFGASMYSPRLIANMRETGAIFRPFDNPHVDRFVEKVRGRFGIRLFSRKAGFKEAQDLVRRGGWTVVLFDQNAGRSGALLPLFGRTASCTDLPGLLCKRFKVRPYIVYFRRTAFWRAEMGVEDVACDANDPASVTIATNAWLEDYLMRSDDHLADWLWSHQRWRTQDQHKRRFRLEARKDWLREASAFRGLTAIPRRTRFWIRMPNWLGDVVMAIPLVRALESGRPDGAITLLARAGFVPFLERMLPECTVLGIPPKDRVVENLRFFWRTRSAYPDTWVTFTNSLRGDLEAWLSQCPKRYGIARAGKPRPLLTHTWPIPDDVNEADIHQTELWHRYFQHFGLRESLDLSPLGQQRATREDSPRLGVFAGTENSPGKRWPVDRWSHLLNALSAKHPDLRIDLFGTSGDAAVNSRIAQAFAEDQVTDWSGKTSLVDLCERIADVDVVVCNDSGGMHLANLLGVPVVAIFGPTNPVRTGPIFEAPTQVVRPVDCPAHGGAPIEGISAAMVVAAVSEYLGG